MITRKQLIGMLGTYWSKNYQDDPFIQGLLEGQLALQRQVETNWEELALSAYRKHIPIHHTEHVHAIFLDPAKKNTCPASLVKFNTPNAYFLSPGVNPNWFSMCDRYGIPSIMHSWYALPLACVVSIEKIVDDPNNPTIELLPGRDFEILWDSVQFFTDPCLDSKSKEYFLINVKQDFKWIYKHFGYILNLESKSCELYRQIVDDIFGAYIGGSSSVDVFAILATVTGNIVSKDDETVQEVTSNQIVTDKNIYELLPGHKSRVTSGEIIAPGDSLTQEFTPTHINQLAQPYEFPAVLLPKRYLGPDYFYGIAFINENVPIFKIDGQSRFYIGGNRNDVELFWSDFEKHCADLAERGIIPDGAGVNEVLAQCACQYTNQINPYKFFTEHIGRYHYTLLTIDYRAYPSDLTLDSIPLRKLTPPWSTVLIQQHISMETSLSAVGNSNDDLLTSSSAIIESSFNVPSSGSIYSGKL